MLQEEKDSVTSDASKHANFAETVMDHVYVDESGHMIVDFDLRNIEVVLFTAAKTLDGVKCHIKISRRGSVIHVHVLDPAYAEPLRTDLSDWSVTGLGPIETMKKDDIDSLCMIILSRIIIKAGEAGEELPQLFIDLEAREKPIKIITEAMSLVGEKFVVTCFRLGPSLILKATSLCRATIYNLEVDEGDWSNTGFGSLKELVGTTGESGEDKVVELCRR